MAFAILSIEDELYLALTRTASGPSSAASATARCLDILVSFQGCTAGQAYTVEIIKPLYDRSRHFLGRDEPGQIAKPDFEGKICAVDGRFLRSLVIEVLGLDTPVYREKKRRLR